MMNKRNLKNLETYLLEDADPDEIDIMMCFLIPSTLAAHQPSDRP